MASLVEIPPELMGSIGAELVTGDILSLCKSSKGLYAATHPLLFRHITIKWDSSAAPDEPPNVTSLLQFILRNPSYARYIKRVDIPNVMYSACLGYSSRLSNEGSPWRWGPEDTALVRAVIEECRLPDGEEWYTAVVEEADLGAIIALVLAQCTHLESLTVDINLIPPSNPWFSDVISRALSPPEGPTRLSGFNKLTHVAVSELNLDDDDDDDDDLPAQATLLFFYLPSVTTLCFDNAPYIQGKQPWDPTVAGYNLEHLAWPLADPPLAASLTTLQLESTAAPARAVEFLLGRTPNLRSLVYDCDLASSCSPLDLRALRRGLSHVRDTLARLVVRFDIFADEALDPESLVSVTSGSLGSLSDMAALEDLEVCLGVLFGQAEPEEAPPLAHVLPPGLKRLVVNDDLWNYSSWYRWEGEPFGAVLMTFFAGACRIATPALEEFGLDMGEHGYMGYEYWTAEGNIEKLQQLLQGQGIRCLIHFDPAIYF